jgi:hypothetical protein
MSIHRSFGPDSWRQTLRFLLPRLALVLLFATLLLYALAVVPSVSYHVRDLFGPNPSLPQALLFALVVLFALGPPSYLGLQLIRLTAGYAWLFPIGILVHAAIVFLGFRFATPIASVHDLLGEPVWNIGDELERMIRFVGLFIAVSVPIAGGTALLYAATRSYAPQRLLWWVLFAVLLLGLSDWIVVGLAATDNVTVLLRNSAVGLAWLGFSLWLMLLSFVASLVAERLAGVFTGTVATLFAALLFLPLTFGVLFLATDQSVGGPASDLTAMEFLLSADRDSYFLTFGQLFARYAAAYAVTIVLLAFSQYLLWLGYSTRRFSAGSPQDRLTRPGLGAADGS